MNGKQVGDWDEIHGFATPLEFEQFELWIAEAIDEGMLEEVDVGALYSGSAMFEERWFRTRVGVIWRVVAPDPPFRGVFETIR